MAEPTDITGQRFGKLTALHPGKRKSKYGKYWLCLCDCGEFTERTTAALRFSRKQGLGMACIACAKAHVRDRSGRALKRAVYARLFLNTGRVWSYNSDERLIRNVRRALSNEGHQAPPIEEISLPVAGYSLLDAIEMRRAVEMPSSVAERIKRANDHRVRVRRRSEEAYRAQRERELKAYAERERKWQDRFRARL